MMSFAVYLFIVVALLMLVVALAWIGPHLFSAPGVRAGPDRKTTGLNVYRDELTQLTCDYECGRLSARALEEAQMELGRRLLDEANDQEEVTQDRMRSPSRMAGLVVMLLVPFFAAGLYLKVGSFEALSASESGLSELDYYQTLQTHLKNHPDDGRSWVALARFEMEAHRFSEAANAFEKARNVSPKVANDATVLCELAEAVGMMQGGTYNGQPRQLVREAMALEPNNPLVLEMAGSAAYEAHDYAGAAMHWKKLRTMMMADSQSYTDISAAIAHAEAEAVATLQQNTIALPGMLPAMSAP